MLLALSGWKRSGKDTCADYFVNRYGFVKRSFASPLKDMASESWGIPRDWFDLHKERPLLQFPARAEDAWTKVVMSMLMCHLRSESGLEPQSYRIMKGVVVGFFHRWTWFAWLCATFRLPFCTQLPLFHTPRSILVNDGSAKRVIDPDFWVKKAFLEVDPSEATVFADLRYPNEARGLKERGAILIRINRFDTTAGTDASERSLDHYVFDHYVDNRAVNHEALDQCDAILQKKP